ncbi:MAG TPA: hypothetical protein VKW06_23065 [Candidatus Angelobacter sp.]|nr:hypothetical protein [Candidatus Angelobacter sp.]
MQTSFAGISLWFLMFPCLLLVYYAICWALFGNHEKIRSVPPRYDPPNGVSPGMARYILTGGSDGTTLAAILAALAARGTVAVEPQDPGYKLRLLRKDDAVLPEEAAVVKVALGTALEIQPYALCRPSPAVAVTVQSGVVKNAWGENQWVGAASDSAVINPRLQAQIASILNAVQAAFRENLEGVYFLWHWGCGGLGMLATFLWAVSTSFLVRSSSSLFLTVWLFFFTSIAGLAFGGVLTSRPKRPTLGQRLQVVIIPLLFFVLPGFIITHFAMPSAQGFVLALLLSVLLNSTFLVLLRAPTAAGQQALEELAGFREFLIRVEQDRLDRVNSPEQRAELMDRFLPYAIALGVKEGWGDTMASSFSNAIVER